jgi:hypothetical protein
LQLSKNSARRNYAYTAMTSLTGPRIMYQ